MRSRSGYGVSARSGLQHSQFNKAASAKNSILLVDELELGLEPHRIRLLLERLKAAPDGSDRKDGQVIFTTHSPIPVMALPVDQLRFVRSVDGKTSVEKVLPECANNLQGVTRTQAHAFLGRRLVVCEGATEVGLCRGLAEFGPKHMKVVTRHSLAACLWMARVALWLRGLPWNSSELDTT